MVVSTNSTTMAAVPIIGSVETYAWGIHGEKSLVAKIWKANNDGDADDGDKATINENKPYAEVQESPYMMTVNHF